VKFGVVKSIVASYPHFIQIEHSLSILPRSPNCHAYLYDLMTDRQQFIVCCPFEELRASSFWVFSAEDSVLR
jgi:hypothetical protein